MDLQGKNTMPERSLASDLLSSLSFKSLTQATLGSDCPSGQIAAPSHEDQELNLPLTLGQGNENPEGEQREARR